MLAHFLTIYPSLWATEDQEKRDCQINSQLEENASLLEQLSQEQHERLSRQLPATLNSLPPPSQQELQLGKSLCFKNCKRTLGLSYSWQKILHLRMPFIYYSNHMDMEKYAYQAGEISLGWQQMNRGKDTS